MLAETCIFLFFFEGNRNGLPFFCGYIPTKKPLVFIAKRMLIA